jgi:hypothetical protein
MSTEHRESPAHVEQLEHSMPFFPVPTIDPRAFDAIHDALRLAVDGEVDRADPCQDALDQLEEHFQQLDRVAGFARKMVTGDTEAHGLFLAWFESHNDRPVHSHDQHLEPIAVPVPPGAMDHHHHDHEDDARGMVGETGPLFSMGPTVDVLLGASFVASSNEVLFDRYSSTIHQYVHDPTLLLDLLVGTAMRRPHGPGEDASNLLLTLLSELNAGRDLSDLVAKLGGLLPDRLHELLGALPSELEMCLLELQELARSPSNPVGQAARFLIESKNNAAIIGMSPNVLCVPGQTTLYADAGNPFDSTQPANVGIVIGSCHTSASVAPNGWTDQSITISVSEWATSGLVYFVGIISDSQAAEIAAGKVHMLEQLRESCPALGRSAGRGSMLLGHFGTPGLCPAPVRFADNRNFLTVEHKPKIASFTAIDKSGSVVAGRMIEACSEITLLWQVTSNPTQIRIPAASAALLAASGSLTVSVDQTKSFTLEATNSCGTTLSTITVNVFGAVHLSTSLLSLDPGQSAPITVTISCPASSDTLVDLASSSPNDVSAAPDGASTDPNAPNAVRIKAGDKSGGAIILAANNAVPRARRPAATVSARAVNHVASSVDVWVRSQRGQWRVLPQSLDLVPVHAAMLHTGRVLFFSWDENDIFNVNKGKSQLWDPRTDAPATPNHYAMGRNLFCSGHCLLPDGRLLVAGGQSDPGVGGVGADHDIHTFNPDPSSPWRSVWMQYPSMPGARWYPTCATLPKGTALIVGGAAARPLGVTTAMNTEFEIFSANSGSLSPPKHLGNPGSRLYPFMQVFPGTSQHPDGIVFVHSNDESNLFSLTTQKWLQLFRTKSPYFRSYPHQGACVVLPIPASAPNDIRLLIVGGEDFGNLATDKAEIFDYNPSNPTQSPGWRNTNRSSGQPLRHSRRFMSDAVLLPDGSVLVVNGASLGEADTSSSSVQQPELFNPENEAWSNMALQSRARLYHSVALLLPDGRVLVAGNTGQFNPGNPVDDRTIEIFEPPYLFRGPRPNIGHVPNHIGYGHEFLVNCPQSSTIDSVALIRMSSTTHTNNMDQRHLWLSIVSKGSGVIRVKSPLDSGRAPPGFYMLFVITGVAMEDRVPSEAAIIQVG